MEPSASAAPLVAALLSPQTWIRHEPLHDSLPGPPWTHATISVSIHSAAVVRHLQKQYSLAPPSASSALRRAAMADHNVTTLPDDVKTSPSTPDTRFWTVLHNVTRRGPLGLVQPHTSEQNAGWWIAAPHQPGFHAADAVAASERPHTEPNFVWDVTHGNPPCDAESRGLQFLEIHAALSSGKRMDEFAACVRDGNAKLQIVALDCVERFDTSTKPTLPTDAHTSMVNQMPFNLHETPQQRDRREQVPLPYTYQLESDKPSGWRGSTGQSAIFFEPESEDDEDDEDPDDDLDL